MSPSFETISTARVRDLIAGPPGLRVSIYIPVPTDVRSNGFGRLTEAYRAALEEASSRMASMGVDAGKASETTRRLQQPTNWSSLHAATTAIGVFLGPEGLRRFAMTRPLEASVHIGRTFHLRPLLASAHLDLAYRVVSLTADHAEFFEGDSWGLRRVEGERTQSSPGQTRGHDAGDGALALLTSSLRRIWSERSDPIVLVADRALAQRFREVADLPGLLDQGLNGGGPARSDKALHEHTRDVVRDWIDECDRRTLVEARAALSRGGATEELSTAAEVAATGGVSNLLVAQEARIAKHIDTATGALLESLGDEDALDELCGLVLARGGNAAVIDWAADEAGTPFIAELRH